MKYKIKGYEKKEVCFDIEADSYEQAFKKARENYEPGGFEVLNINDELVTCLKEAEWIDDNSIFDGSIDRIKSVFADELEVLKYAMKNNKGIDYFYVSFSGEGDDGQINYCGVEPHTLNDVVYDCVGSYSISNILEQIAGYFFDSIPIDWVNDQGGSGQINFKLDNDELVLEIECRAWESVEAENFRKTVRFK